MADEDSAAGLEMLLEALGAQKANPLLQERSDQGVPQGPLNPKSIAQALSVLASGVAAVGAESRAEAASMQSRRVRPATFPSRAVKPPMPALPGLSHAGDRKWLRPLSIKGMSTFFIATAV